MSEEILPVEIIENKIYFIRVQKVMIDSDLAKLYGVETGYLNRQVRHNIDRFPADFMFQLSKEEASNLKCNICISSLRCKNCILKPTESKGTLRCQIGTLKRGEHYKYMPYAFTEHGILMLSSVLRSPRAIHVNIQIMRAFVRLRRILAENKEIARKLELLEKRIFKHDSDIRQLVRDIRKLAIEKPRNKLKVGFLPTSSASK